jgi:hypothetical protein
VLFAGHLCEVLFLLGASALIVRSLFVARTLTFDSILGAVCGDISPVSPAARTLSWMETITGQFYLAVIVAGLVSVLAARGQREGVP